MEEFERAVVPRGSHLRVVFASSQEVCIREWLVSFSLHIIGLVLCFRLLRYICVPHATSYESLLHLYGDFECAWMLKSVPVSLAFLSSSPKMPLVVLV